MSSNLKIGITERGDASVHLDEWKHKTPSLDAIIAITKAVTPELVTFLSKPEVATKTILHATITGYGGTQLEPNVPTPKTNFAHIKDLISKGFPVNQIVLRIDPIILTKEGLRKVEYVLELFEWIGIRRVRFSFLKYYKHANERFKAIDWQWPYSNDEIKRNCFKLFLNFSDYEFQACTTDVPVVHKGFCTQTGCISLEDIKILRLTAELSKPSHQQSQQSACMCCSAKTELLTHNQPCKHGCLYCYYHDFNLEKKRGIPPSATQNRKKYIETHT